MKNYFIKSILTSITWLLVFTDISYAATFIVTKTIDDGSSGTLRWAITQANATPGYDVINFNILPAGNTFESSGANNWPVITLGSALPVITETALINGTTQPNTNTGFIAGINVGVDAHLQPNIDYPDVYITCGYALPTDENLTTGNGLGVNAVNVTIQGLAISGFGNTNTNQPDGIAHADISILRPAAARNANTVITGCFLSCDPRGNYPSIAARRTKGNGILVCGFNDRGTINANYISHSGGYGIVFHATINNNIAGTNQTLRPSRNWNMFDNQIINIGRSTLFIAAGGRAADCISMMNTLFCTAQFNYCADFEQFGIDLGHNTDDNLVDNNTVTGFVKTNGSAPCGGVRTGFSSQRNTVSKNRIINNASITCLAGIWADEGRSSFAGAVIKNNDNFFFTENEIANNRGSGIVLSTNGVGTVTLVTISRNAIYNNTGLGIDLNFTNLVGPTAVTVNDNNDADAGTNNRQNFPLIDSAKINASGILHIWGKAPSGATLEFFGSDGGVNNHGGRSLNYGEGRYYIGTGVENSAQDLVAGSNTVAGTVDGNIGNIGTLRMFRFAFAYAGPQIDLSQLTSTATVGGNTSEFGPVVPSMIILGCSLFDVSALYKDNTTKISWSASCDDQFSSFVVEKGTDGLHFSRIGDVVPKQSQSFEFETKFEFTDFFPKEGNNYYRLKMVNKDGSFKYSNILRVGIGSNNSKMKLSPNPFVNEVNLSVSMKNIDNVTVKLMDMNGRIFLTREFKGQKGLNVFNVDGLDRFPKGHYLVKVSWEDQSYTEKIVRN